jgi:hypothetical protein
MNIRTVSIALIAAGAGVLASRIRLPDAERIEAALRTAHAHGTTGIAAARFEITALVADLPPVDIRAVAVGLSALVVLALTVALLWQMRSRRTRRPPHAEVMQRRVTRARSLSREGRLGIDVARETALSRDAVELLHHLGRPDELSGAGRSYRGRARRSAQAQMQT